MVMEIKMMICWYYVQDELDADDENKDTFVCCSGQSGDYHCKAATFTHEETSTHTLTVFGERT